MYCLLDSGLDVILGARTGAKTAGFDFREVSTTLVWKKTAFGPPLSSNSQK